MEEWENGRVGDKTVRRCGSVEVWKCGNDLVSLPHLHTSTPPYVFSSPRPFVPASLVRKECAKRFGEAQIVVRAPGRVNLIGEHTDYNDGFVLPVAIDREIWLAARAREDSRCRLYSLTLQQSAEFDLRALKREEVPVWARYAAGVALALQEDTGQPLGGFEGVVGSTLPVGAGLSSSAAFEAVFAVLWNEINRLHLDRWTLARLCQRAENEFVGLQCGIMDQAAALLGKAGHALFLDTRSFETRHIPLLPEAVIVVADTGKKRELGESEYNRRRQECEAAVKSFSQFVSSSQGEIHALRDVSPALLAQYAPLLPETPRKRARHVVGENERVLAFLEALEQRDQNQIGFLMQASHASLRDDYEVSCPELEAMVAACRAAPGCIGVRLTGAGFGGACVALVESGQVEAFLIEAERGYRSSSAYPPLFHVCRAVDGAGVGEQVAR